MRPSTYVEPASPVPGRPGLSAPVPGAGRGVLVLAYWYPPENESGALRPFRFCKYLPGFGYAPVVVVASSGTIKVDDSPNVTRTPDARSRDRKTAWLARVGRVLQRVLPYNDCLEWVADAVATGSRVLGERNISTIVSTSPPVATHLAALRLKRRFRLRWIADFRDPLAGNPFRTRLHGRLYDAIVERSILACADAIIVNTDAAHDALVRRYPGRRDKIHLIWNGYDPEDKLSAADIPVRRHKLVAHFGSIYGGRHPGMLLNSVQRLVRRGSLDRQAIRIRLVGSLDRDQPWIPQSAFGELVSGGMLETTDGPVPRGEAQRQMQQTDYLLLLDLNELETGLQVPAKLFEYIRIGRPILTFTTPGSPVERILRQAAVPHACIYREDTDDEVDRKVLALLSMSTEVVRPSSWFEHQFDARLQTKTLAAVIDAVAGETRQTGGDARRPRE